LLAAVAISFMAMLHGSGGIGAGGRPTA